MRAWLFSLLLLPLVSGVSQDKPHPDLSGRWVLSIDESTFEDNPPPVAATLEIRQEDHHIRLNVTIVRSDGHRDITEVTLLFNSKKNDFEATAAHSRRITAFWYGDSLALDKTPVSKGIADTVHDMTLFSLEENGKRLVAAQKNQTPEDKVYNNRFVFRKATSLR